MDWALNNVARRQKVSLVTNVWLFIFFSAAHIKGQKSWNIDALYVTLVVEDRQSNAAAEAGEIRGNVLYARKLF